MCHFERPLTEDDLVKLRGVSNLEVQQKTPVRVLHRRAALTRPRTINWCGSSPQMSGRWQRDLLAAPEVEATERE